MLYYQFIMKISQYIRYLKSIVSINKLVILFLIVLMIFQLITRTFNSFVDFDEGYNLQISYNLRNQLAYSTFELPFDYKISTGPTVLIPAAFLINNNHFMLPRLVLVVYSLLFIYFIYKKVTGSYLEKIIFLILLNLLPLFYFFSTHIFGEIPAFFFLLACYYFYGKNKFFISGIFIGLSILTKSIFVIGMLPIFVFIIYNKIKNTDSKVLQEIHNLIVIMKGLLLILFLWNLFVFISVELNTNVYINTVTQFFQYTQQLSKYRPDLLISRFQMIRFAFNTNPLLLILISLFACFYVFFNKKRIIFLQLLSLFFVIYFNHFLFLGATNWYRHLFPAMLAVTVIIPFFISTFFEKLNAGKIVLISIVLAIFIADKFNKSNQINPENYRRTVIEQNLIFLDQNEYFLLKQHQLLRSQTDTAQYIKNNLPETEKIAGLGWLNAPEISYLIGMKIGRNPLEPDAKFIIYHIYGLLSSKGYAYYGLDRRLPNKKLIYQNFGYEIYQKN